MKPTAPTSVSALQDKAFLVLLVTVSLAFAWILWPFYGAIFWATMLAIVFRPLHRRLVQRLRERRTLAAFATLTILLLMVILPAAVLTSLLLHEALALYARLESREFDFGRYLQQFLGVLPAWMTGLLDRFGLTSLGAVQEKFAGGLTKGFQFFAAQALNIGQGALQFVIGFFIMLYLLFFPAARRRRACPAHA
jgi:predicted PurR-regulated permease PerM